ncbi:MAG: hypothetical protein LV481_15010 [Methylacidiphilales bacterium]|nr:hypothetical protein [Candidatus Methylacidiphilales bacterium]
MAKARQFKEFLPAIFAHPPKGEVATVIGGQAVNYWCEQACRKNPELASYRPFTSEDLDVVARQRAQTLAIARATGLKLVEVEQGYAGTDRAALVDTSGERPETVIQVLSGMYGVTDRDLERDTAEVLIRDKQGKERMAKIANRTALIKGKIALALAPDGVRNAADKEHDRFHLKLLILCMAVATRDLMEAVGKEQEERAVIKSLKALLKVIRGNDAERISAIDPSVVWKRAIAPEILRINSSRLPKLYHYVASELLPWINAP